MSSLTTYIKETKHEFASVNWPSRRQSMIFSGVVIVISVLVALFLAIFDFGFSRVLDFVISRVA